MPTVNATVNTVNPVVDPLTSAQATLNGLMIELQNETAYRAVNGPKPTYSVGGRNFDWSGYLRTMQEMIRAQLELVNMLDTTEIHVRGWTGV